MSISIATFGKFWPQAGFGIYESQGIGGAGGGSYIERKKKPIVLISKVNERDNKIKIEVISVDEV